MLISFSLFIFKLNNVYCIIISFKQSFSAGNTGYFGIPLALILLNEGAANLYIFAIIVSFLFEYSVGFLIISRGQYIFAQSVLKILKIPVLYALLAGLICNSLHVSFSESILKELMQF